MEEEEEEEEEEGEEKRLMFLKKLKADPVSPEFIWGQQPHCAPGQVVRWGGVLIKP